MKKKGGKNRQIKYDVIRVIAMLSVVLMHLCAHIAAESNSIKWLAKSAILLLLSTCNGLFFLLSGKFNLTVKNAEEPIKFYKRRAISVLIPFLVCSFMCFIVEKSLLGTDSSYIISLISDFPKTHYWFVYELVGLILWTPFFAVMMNKTDLNGKLIMTAVVLTFQFVFVGMKDIGIYPGYEFPLMGWPLFYLVGSFADDIPHVWKKRIIVIGVACFIISMMQARFLPYASHGLQDLSPKYFFSVLAIYYGIQILRVPEMIEKGSLYLARYSYYVYLFHNTVITLFFSDSVGIYDSLISKIGTFWYLAVTAVSSIIVSMLLGIVIKFAIGSLSKKYNC